MLQTTTVSRYGNNITIIIIIIIVILVTVVILLLSVLRVVVYNIYKYYFVVSGSPFNLKAAAVALLN